MAAVRVGEKAYITFSPPWGKRMYKMGRLGFEPGKIPSHLIPFLLRKGDVQPIASECRAAGNRGTSMIRCINTKVALAKGRRGLAGR